MFTGLIQGMGRIDKADNLGGQTRFRIAAMYDLSNIVAGESIAVNGTCLTVELFGDRWFTAYASAETLSKSSLGGLRIGSKVNLERAMAMGDRFGGHIVAGHVDCVAEVKEVKPAGESTIFVLGFPKEFGPQVVDKGSVALDGISLTVNSCTETTLSVNIIPATIRETTISEWSPGRKVNMETDVIGKYVQKMLGPWTNSDTGATDSDSASGSGSGSGISMDFLNKIGF